MTVAENSAELEAEIRQQDIFYYCIKSFDQEELIEAVQDAFKKIEKLNIHYFDYPTFSRLQQKAAGAMGAYRERSRRYREAHPGEDCLV